MKKMLALALVLTLTLALALFGCSHGVDSEVVLMPPSDLKNPYGNNILPEIPETVKTVQCSITRYADNWVHIITDSDDYWVLVNEGSKVSPPVGYYLYTPDDKVVFIKYQWEENYIDEPSPEGPRFNPTSSYEIEYTP